MLIDKKSLFDGVSIGFIKIKKYYEQKLPKRIKVKKKRSNIKKISGGMSSGHAVILISVAFVIGAFLRLYFIADQILVDDEWHGIFVSGSKSYLDLLTHFWQADSSIPYNIYRKLVLNFISWNEIVLRLPALFAGLLSLVIFPAIVWKLFNKRISVIFSFLLAISPSLIFHSRFCRPYSIVVLLSFVAVVCYYYWLVTRQRAFIICYIFAATVSTYFHLSAVVAAFIPLLLTFAIKRNRYVSEFTSDRIQELPTYTLSISIFLITFLFILMLVLPPYLVSHASINTKLGIGNLSLGAFLGTFELLSGTSNAFMKFVYLCLIVSGFKLLFKNNRLLFIIAGLILIFYFLATVISSPADINIPIVMMRYNASIIPYVFLAVSLSINSFSSYLGKSFKLGSNSNFMFYIILIVFVSILYFSGPLRQAYFYPNNFTNHSAYQESYKEHTLEKPYISDFGKVFRITKDNVPDFYKALGKELENFSIVEYPVYIPDNINVHYYYQKIHKKKIIAGYFWAKPIHDKRISYVEKLFHMGYFLNIPGYEDRINFINMINLLKLSDIAESDAKYIVLHKNLIAEMRQIESLNIRKDIEFLSEYYREHLGEPLLNSKWLIVFQVNK